MNFGQPSKFIKSIPPEKGSFPLDHDGECKLYMIKYMRCMRDCNNENSKCRVTAKDYMECRMDRNLMLREDLSKLGFKDLEIDDHHQSPTTTSSS